MTTQTITLKANQWIARIDNLTIGSYSCQPDAIDALRVPYICLYRDEETGDLEWGAFYSGMLIGYYAEHRTAITALDKHVYTLITKNPIPLDPATITMSIDADRLYTAYNAAMPKVTDKPFWSVALRKAYHYLRNRKTVTIDGDGNLVIESTTQPGTIYRANCTCQCPGNAHHRHCWHCAAYRLLEQTIA